MLQRPRDSYSLAVGTISPKPSGKATTSTMEGFEKMQPRPSKRVFFEPQRRKWAFTSKSHGLDLLEKRTAEYNI